MTETPKAQDSFVEDYERLGRNGASRQPSWIRQIRAEAMARFAELGFPTTRAEEWKYTNVAPIAGGSFRMADGSAHGPSAGDLADVSLRGDACAELVFVDGRYAAELSFPGAHPEGVYIGSLAAASLDRAAVLAPHLARYADHRGHSFVALNTAFLCDGGFVLLPRDVALDGPVHLLFVSTASEQPTASHPRNLILAAEGSRATVVETYVGLGNGVYFTNATTEVVAGERSSVTHCKVEREANRAYHVATVQAELAGGANFTSQSVSVGGALVRNDLNAALRGEGSECVLDGFFLGSGNQHIDNHTRIEHLKPNCVSRELYKGVLDGTSRGVFNGRIAVHKGAQGTDARQTNKNLLLSDAARIDTQPQLEIYADDVKCSHGSTIGQIDAEALFYLRTRGLGREQARSLLTFAFGSEMIARIPVAPLRARLESLLVSRFGTAPTAAGELR